MAPVGLLAAGWPVTAWPVTFVMCSGGFANILYAFGLGYGLSMMANGCLTLAVARHRGFRITPFALACGGLYTAYGLRLTAFLWRRQCEPSYAPRLQAAQEKTDRMSLGQRGTLVASISLSQALYALPLKVATMPIPSRSGNPVFRAVGWTGVAVASVGLVLEHMADEQKLAAKRRDPLAPVTDGLYRYCRHPNYLGEMLFHAGVCCFASCGTFPQLCLSSVAPLFMASVMVTAAVRLDKESDNKYSSAEGYRKWAHSTPSLFPRFQ